jgi:plastocyanin
MTGRIATWALLALCAAAPCAGKGVIHGTLKAPGRGGAPASQGGARLKDAVIYLQDAPAKLEKKLAKKARRDTPSIVQKDLRFSPRVLAVAAGDTVRFRNLDRVYHNTFSVSPARRFDLGKYPPGHVSPVVFDSVGIVNLHCDIHPDEAGFVAVVPNHLFTRPDSLGRFEMPKVPPGAYTLRIWHPRFGTLRQDVDVPRRGDTTLELRF